MLVRVVIAFVLALAASDVCCGAVERDYLQRGEEKPTDHIDRAYDTWIRRILARGWQKDVVLRTADRPAFYPEGVTGILRTRDGYAAFRVEPSLQIWEALGYGSTDPHHPKDQIKTVRPVFHQRPLKQAIAARIAAIWRHVLGDPRNYGKDPNMYLDTSTFTYYLAFAPSERITAHITGWGPKTEQMILLTDALGDYAFGKKSEQNLLNVLSKAEKKLRI